MPGKNNGGEGLSVLDSIVLVSSVRAYGPVGEAIGKDERVASFGGVGLGLLEAGRYRRPALGHRGWSVVSESVLAFVYYFGLSVAMASSQLWVERSTLVVNRALLY